MKPVKNSMLLLLFCLFQVSFLAGVRAEEKPEEVTLSADGPYILYQEDSVQFITVTPDGQIEKNTLPAPLPKDYRFEVVSHDMKHRFEVQLHPVERPTWRETQPEKVFVMSDPHGDLDCVISLLQGNGVIDNAYHWSYGTNRLVVIGDVFDRGNDVTQIFWLIYKLEEEARLAGGEVSFLLGNHEPLVLMNGLRYTKGKYKLLAEKLGVEYPELWNRSSELGRWLCTRNTMMLIGRNLFVHAGLSRDFYDQNLEIPVVNEEMSKGLYKKKAERKAASPLIYFLFGNQGPIWYRGLVKQDPKYSPIAADSLNLILERYDADRIVVGHTIFDDISTFYDNKVVAVNVSNAKNREAKKGRGILIEKGVIYVVGDEGVQRTLIADEKK